MPTGPAGMDGDLMVYYAIGLVVLPIALFLVGYLYVRHRFTRFANRVVKEMSGNQAIGLSRTCPKCGSAEYSKSRQMRGQFLINCDLVCSQCKTLYTAPVPGWISVSFILTGMLLLVAIVALCIYVGLTFPEFPLAVPIVLLLGGAVAAIFVVSGITKLISARQLADLPERLDSD
jgi:Flp pilus assembly protein TadB